MWTKELRHFRTWKRGDGTDRAWLTEESKGEDTKDSCRASDGMDSIVVGFWDFGILGFCCNFTLVEPPDKRRAALHAVGVAHNFDDVVVGGVEPSGLNLTMTKPSRLSAEIKHFHEPP